MSELNAWLVAGVSKAATNAALRSPPSLLHEAQRLRTDMAIYSDKLAGGPERRNFEAAMRLQIARQDRLAGGLL